MLFVTGKVARTIGAAPFSPTQEIKSFSLTEIFDKERDKKIAIGLEIKINMLESIKLDFQDNISLLGKIKSPSIKNINICISIFIDS